MDKLPELPKDVTFTGLHDEDGSELWISDKGRVEHTEQSEERYVPPGKVEAHTSGRVVFEIPATAIVKECHVKVWNDVEGSTWIIGMPLGPGTINTKGPWFEIWGSHLYQEGKRVIGAYLENWSHTYGRRFFIFVRYDLGSRMNVVRKGDGSRSIES